jgi:hypothetical protein
MKILLKEAIGINYLNRRITHLFISKAPIEKVNELEFQLSYLRNAIESLQKEGKSDNFKLVVEKSPVTTKKNFHEPIGSNWRGQKFIFICGLHRSGTTLFTKIMQKHPNVCGFNNTGVIEDEGQFLQTVYPPDSELGWPGAFGYSEESHLTEDSDLISDSNKEKLFSQWSNFLPHTCEYIIEKSPPNLLKTRFLQAMFPNSYFIVIKRNPIATSLATKKWNTSPMLSIINHWLHCYDLWDSDKKRIDKFMEIKYEDFIDNPAETFSAACNFCNLDFENSIKDEVLNYNFSKNVNGAYFKEWKKHSFQSKLVSLLYRRRIEKHGYNLQ